MFKAMKKNIVCIDRDGTLIFDSKSHLFLGKDDNWKSGVRVLPFVTDGLRRLSRMPGTIIYMITNQAGVSITDFPSLTLKKAHLVCRYVVKTIKEEGGFINGYFLCPHATPQYVKNSPGKKFDNTLVHDCKYFKPAPGMVLNILKKEHVRRGNANIYVIGDRSTDVETALNIDGVGILIPSENEPGEKERTRSLKSQSNVFVARNMLEAAEIIEKISLTLRSQVQPDEEKNAYYVTPSK